MRQAQYSAILTDRGTFVDDCIVYRTGPNSWMLVHGSGSGHEEIVKHAAGRNCAVLFDDDLHDLSLQGPLTVGAIPLTKVHQATLITTSGQWVYKSGQGRGSLTLTSASPRVAGTYEFDMSPLAGTTGATRFVQGSFDVSYGNGTVCK